jgi:hypothetical protein
MIRLDRENAGGFVEVSFVRDRRRRAGTPARLRKLAESLAAFARKRSDSKTSARRPLGGLGGRSRIPVSRILRWSIRIWLASDRLTESLTLPIGFLSYEAPLPERSKRRRDALEPHFGLRRVPRRRRRRLHGMASRRFLGGSVGDVPRHALDRRVRGGAEKRR